jgi:rhamnulokinase
MVPDYLHYLLTGKKVSEYTNATTTNLVTQVPIGTGS